MTTWVQIAVPEEIAAAITLQVADFLRGDVAPEPQPEFAWDEERLARLAEIINPSLGRMLDYLAERPDTRVRFDDVRVAVGSGRTRMVARLGGFTNQIKSEFGVDVWPMEADGVRGTMFYWMTPEVAALWMKVRAA